MLYIIIGAPLWCGCTNVPIWHGCTNQGFSPPFTYRFTRFLYINCILINVIGAPLWCACTNAHLWYVCIDAPLLQVFFAYYFLLSVLLFSQGAPMLIVGISILMHIAWQRALVCIAWQSRADSLLVLVH